MSPPLIGRANWFRGTNHARRASAGRPAAVRRAAADRVPIGFRYPRRGRKPVFTVRREASAPTFRFPPSTFQCYCTRRHTIIDYSRSYVRAVAEYISFPFVPGHLSTVLRRACHSESFREKNHGLIYRNVGMNHPLFPRKTRDRFFSCMAKD